MGLALAAQPQRRPSAVRPASGAPCRRLGRAPSHDAQPSARQGGGPGAHHPRQHGAALVGGHHWEQHCGSRKERRQRVAVLSVAPMASSQQHLAAATSCCATSSPRATRACLFPHLPAPPPACQVAQGGSHQACIQGLGPCLSQAPTVRQLLQWRQGGVGAEMAAGQGAGGRWRSLMRPQRSRAGRCVAWQRRGGNGVVPPCDGDAMHASRQPSRALRE